MPFSAVWSGSTLFAILCILIRVYTICHFFLSSIIKGFTVCHAQQSIQGLYSLPFSAVWSRSRCTMSFSETVWLGSTLFAILSILINVYTVCHSQQSDQGLHYLTFSALYDQGLHYLPFSAVWSRSTLFAILSSLINVYTICHSHQSDQGLHCLTLSAVWSGSILFVILISLMRGYTVCHSQQSDQVDQGEDPHCHSQEKSDKSLYYLPF